MNSKFQKTNPFLMTLISKCFKSFDSFKNFRMFKKNLSKSFN